MPDPSRSSESPRRPPLRNTQPYLLLFLPRGFSLSLMGRCAPSRRPPLTRRVHAYMVIVPRDFTSVSLRARKKCPAHAKETRDRGGTSLNIARTGTLSINVRPVELRFPKKRRKLKMTARAGDVTDRSSCARVESGRVELDLLRLPDVTRRATGAAGARRRTTKGVGLFRRVEHRGV